MGKKNKLAKFAAILSYPNVVESYDMNADLLTIAPGEEVDLRGRWKSDFFQKDQPLCLELACGKGDYAHGLGRMYPDKNYLGVDIKGNRIWKGALRAIEEERDNVKFLRTRIERIEKFFDEGEVDEIWITFPDPFLRKSKVNRRLTSHYFLNKYMYLLPSGASIHLKTDSPQLYAFSQESLAGFEGVDLVEDIADIYAQSSIKKELEIKTFYEHMHLEDGRTIYYLRAVKK